jgi:hypothetical protein
MANGPWRRQPSITCSGRWAASGRTRRPWMWEGRGGIEEEARLAFMFLRRRRQPRLHEAGGGERRGRPNARASQGGPVPPTERSLALLSRTR